MARTLTPANIEILHLTPDRLAKMRQVKSLDIFDGGSDNFHEDGLFSILTFGRVGSEERDSRFGFIDLKVDIFHPFIFETLIKLKALYKGILTGTEYATWDAKEKDFVKSDMLDGDTGYGFFLQHWQDISFKATGSPKRDIRIKLIKKYRDIALTSKVVVIPAGLRDVTLDETGRTKEGEINEFYRTLISTSNTVATGAKSNDAIYNNTRVTMQNAFNKIYDHIEMLLSGKGGFLLKKWGSRKVFYGTRNVITAMDIAPVNLFEPNYPSHNSTVVGLYQLLKGALPISLHYLLTGILKDTFNASNSTAELVNKTTLMPEIVKLPSDIMDRWTTRPGLEKLINRYGQKRNRLLPMTIEGYYLALIYKDDKHFKIFKSIRDLPEGFSKENVSPITLIEFLYLMGYRRWNQIPLLLTRYPITGDGSVYPSYTYVKTTVNSSIKRELGVDWEPIEGDEFLAIEYPDLTDETFIDSLVPHTSRLAGLGGDFDGDTASALFLITEESKKEVDDYFKTRRAYVSTFGGLKASAVNEITERVLFAFTGD